MSATSASEVVRVCRGAQGIGVIAFGTNFGLPPHSGLQNDTPRGRSCDIQEWAPYGLLKVQCGGKF